MDQIAAALADATRWRILELLAERPRSVGELAELTGRRQPQTTKHLQTLARSGLVSVSPHGQRRVYALETAPLQAFERRLEELVQGPAEPAVAAEEGWADGRTFSFERLLPAPPDVVWRHWVDPDLLAAWWAMPPMTVADWQIHVAEEPEHLVFDLSVLDATGAVSFTGHYDLALSAVAAGTRLRLDLRITDTTAGAVPSIAGIATGWSQALGNLAAHTKGKDAL